MKGIKCHSDTCTHPTQEITMRMFSAPFMALIIIAASLGGCVLPPQQANVPASQRPPVQPSEAKLQQPAAARPAIQGSVKVVDGGDATACSLAINVMEEGKLVTRWYSVTHKGNADVRLSAAMSDSTIVRSARLKGFERFYSEQKKAFNCVLIKQHLAWQGQTNKFWEYFGYSPECAEEVARLMRVAYPRPI